MIKFNYKEYVVTIRGKHGRVMVKNGEQWRFLSIILPEHKRVSYMILIIEKMHSLMYDMGFTLEKR